MARRKDPDEQDRTTEPFSFAASLAKKGRRNKEEREEEARRWLAENAEAIRLSNEEIERNGLWCDDYRLF